MSARGTNDKINQQQLVNDTLSIVDHVMINFKYQKKQKKRKIRHIKLSINHSINRSINQSIIFHRLHVSIIFNSYIEREREKKRASE